MVQLLIDGTTDKDLLTKAQAESIFASEVPPTVNYPSGLIINNGRTADALVNVSFGANFYFFPLILRANLKPETLSFFKTNINSFSTIIYLFSSGQDLLPSQQIFNTRTITASGSGAFSYSTVYFKNDPTPLNLDNIILQKDKVYWWGVYISSGLSIGLRSIRVRSLHNFGIRDINSNVYGTYFTVSGFNGNLSIDTFPSTPTLTNGNIMSLFLSTSQINVPLDLSSVWLYDSFDSANIINQWLYNDTI